MKLLDSNVLILGAKHNADPALRAVLDEPYAYSIISKIEVLGFTRITVDDRRDLQVLLDEGDEIALTARVVNHAVHLRQQRRMSLGDAIIAATALVHSLPLITRNDRDFRHIAGLTLNPA